MADYTWESLDMQCLYERPQLERLYTSWVQQRCCKVLAIRTSLGSPLIGGLIRSEKRILQRLGQTPQLQALDVDCLAHANLSLLPQLRSLTVRQPHSAYSLQRITTLQRLEHLAVRLQSADLECSSFLGCLSQLRSLEMHTAVEMDALPAWLSTLPHLSSLHLGALSLEAAEHLPSRLGALPQLGLHFECFVASLDGSLASTKKLLQLLGGLPAMTNLVSLEMFTATPILYAQPVLEMSPLSELRSLSSLKMGIMNREHMTITGLELLAALRTLHAKFSRTADGVALTLPPSLRDLYLCSRQLRLGGVPQELTHFYLQADGASAAVLKQQLQQAGLDPGAFCQPHVTSAERTILASSRWVQAAKLRDHLGCSVQDPDNPWLLELDDLLLLPEEDPSERQRGGMRQCLSRWAAMLSPHDGPTFHLPSVVGMPEADPYLRFRGGFML